MAENDEILLKVKDDTTIRGMESFVLKSLKVEDLKENTVEFIRQMNDILNAVPEKDVKGYELSEFSVAAEISGTGKVNLLGSGVDIGAKGTFTFKFTKK